MTELTEAEATKWDDALCPFRENQEDARPDAKALARMLRSDTPLNEAVRDQIAELLESRWGDRSPLARASNWELRPAWAGWRDKWLHERQREGLVLKAVDATPTIAAAMTLASESGVGKERTALLDLSEDQAPAGMVGANVAGPPVEVEVTRAANF